MKKNKTPKKNETPKKNKAPGKDKKIDAAAVRAFIGKWFFVILASFWMFILGVFVGRSTMPFTHEESHLEQEWVQLKKEAKEKEYKKYNIRPDGVSKKSDLGFYEELKKAKTTARMTKKGSHLKNGAANAPSKVRKLPAPGVEIDARPPTLKQRARALKRRFAIQVASLRSAASAEKLTADLTRKGYNAYQRSSVIPGRGEYHRVRIGYFGTRKKAEPLLNALKKKGIRPILVEVDPD